MNLPTYPGESIYIPDMLVAIVALNNYACQYNGEYFSTVKLWIERSKKEWINKETGLLASFLVHNVNSAEIEPPVKGSYSALNCYYLSLVDPDFAKEQYECFLNGFKQSLPVTGIKEYHDNSCLFGFDIDAGPLFLGLSPSGIGFALGAATSLDDMDFRKKLLKTIEIGGGTIRWFYKSHYMVSDLALVAEAIILAMRTSAPQTRLCYK